MNINNKSKCLFLILVICTLLSGCSEKTSYEDESKEELQFICTQTIENAPDNMSFYISHLTGDEYMQVMSDVPDDAELMRTVDNPLTPEVLYEHLKEYILNTGLKELFSDTKECKVAYYKYSYVMKPADNASYYIPVIAFTIEGYGEIYIDIEYGSFVF